MVKLIERMNDYVVMVNTYPYLKREVVDKKNGIVRVYGLDGDLQKINYVIYPKNHYTRQYIEDNILHKYETCPLCHIGVEIDADKRVPIEPKSLVNKKMSLKKKEAITSIVLSLSAIPIALLAIKFLKRRKT